jgi:hypothetical protein
MNAPAKTATNLWHGARSRTSSDRSGDRMAARRCCWRSGGFRSQGRGGPASVWNRWRSEEKFRTASRSGRLSSRGMEADRRIRERRYYRSCLMTLNTHLSLALLVGSLRIRACRRASQTRCIRGAPPARWIDQQVTSFQTAIVNSPRFNWAVINSERRQVITIEQARMNNLACAQSTSRMLRGRTPA